MDRIAKISSDTTFTDPAKLQFIGTSRTFVLRLGATLTKLWRPAQTYVGKSERVSQ